MRERRRSRSGNSRNNNNNNSNRNSDRSSSRGRYNSDNPRGNRSRNGKYNKRRSNKRSFDNGNLRERITVESGYLVLIDQFMLANPQFTEKLSELIDDEPETKDELIRKFGGDVVTIEPGTYKVDRNPRSQTITVHPEGYNGSPDSDNESRSSENKVSIDTRCLAMIDRELLDDIALIEKYQQWWFSEQNKACRDLLRDNGGAVRYGFSKEADEFDIHLDSDKNTIRLKAFNESKNNDNCEVDEQDSDSTED